MGLFDWLFGRKKDPAPQNWGNQPAYTGQTQRLSEDQALERYRYMLRTAPPESVEQAHAEAFEKLTPEQRAQVARELSNELPENERSMTQNPDDSRMLARAATRAEMRQPGTLERSFGGGGPGMGGIIAGSLLSSIAGAFIGTMIAQQLFEGMNDFGAEGDTLDSGMMEEDMDPRVFGGEDMGGGDFGDFGGDF